MSSAPVELLPSAGLDQKHYAEIFGRDSNITEWLTEQISRARKQENYSAESNLHDGARPILVRLDSLRRGGELYGFALQIIGREAKPCGIALEEGDAVVYRRQWHEIKNHIGAMKLYATFLTRKLPEGDERDTVEKMLNGINTLIEYLAQIRRGEAK